MKRKPLWLPLVLLLGLVAGGCGSPAPTAKYSKSEVETKTVEAINAQLKADKVNGTCTRVDLVTKGDREYTGVAYFSDNSTRSGSLLIDTDGKIVWTPDP